MIQRYLRRQPIVRRDIRAAKEYSAAVVFRLLLWVVGIGMPAYFLLHVLAYVVRSRQYYP